MPVFASLLSKPDLRLLRIEAKQRIQAEALYAAFRVADPAYVPGTKSLVAIIDSGLNPHDEIHADRIVAQYDATHDTGSVTDETGHGTEVAGIIGGTGSPAGHSGLAQGVGFIVIKVGSPTLDDQTRTGSIPTVYTTKALEWLNQRRARIEATTGRHLGAVCLATAGGPCVSSPDPGWKITPTALAIRAMAADGVPTVVGAGNSYTDVQAEGMHWPAILPACISVGSTYDADYDNDRYNAHGKVDEIAFYSNRVFTGPSQTSLFAPGSVLTTTSGSDPHGEQKLEGTSAATPVVCGAILLVQELFFLRHGTWPTADLVAGLLKGSAAIKMDRASNLPYRLLNLAQVAPMF